MGYAFTAAAALREGPSASAGRRRDTAPRQVFDFNSRIAYIQRMWGAVLGNDAPRTDHAAGTDPHPGENGAICADPDAVFNDDRLSGNFTAAMNSHGCPYKM